MCDGVIRLVTQAMRQLAHAGPQQNAQPFQPGQPNYYAQPARTAAQVEAERAADEASVSRLKPTHIGSQGDVVGGVQDPTVNPTKWRDKLAQRQRVIVPGESNAEQQRDDDGAVQWLL